MHIRHTIHTHIKCKTVWLNLHTKMYVHDTVKYVSWLSQTNDKEYPMKAIANDGHFMYVLKSAQILQGSRQ